MTIHAGGPARLVYLGSPEIAVRPLEALVAAGHDVALVVTNPDRRRGRGNQLVATPVKAGAERLGLRVSHDINDALTADADLGVVVAFGHILGDEILRALPLLNIHFSLLPRWRGAAPLERAILAGDSETGVCLMRIAKALDEGDVYSRRTVPIGNSTLDELRADLVDASCELLVESLEAGLREPTPQQGEPVYAHKVKAEEHRLNFSQPADRVHRVIRLGRAHTTLETKRLRIVAASVDPSSVGELKPGTLDGLRVATGDGWLVLETVQPEGKRAVDAADWLRGARLASNTVLGQDR